MGAIKHAILGIAASMLVATFCFTALHRMRVRLDTEVLKSTQGEEELKLAGTRARAPGSADFIDTLPFASAHELVLLDIGRSAKASIVDITSLAIQRNRLAPNVMGTVQFALTARANYSATKSWLAYLLNRYPSLTLQSLSLTPSVHATSTQDVRAVLALVTKD
jgi:hypothetical protein